MGEDQDFNPHRNNICHASKDLSRRLEYQAEVPLILSAEMVPEEAHGEFGLYHLWIMLPTPLKCQCRLNARS